MNGHRHHPPLTPRRGFTRIELVMVAFILEIIAVIAAPKLFYTANRTVEAIARGQDRVILVMATGTEKTYTAFQIIWRLWNAG